MPFLATLEYRTATLQKLEVSHPTLVQTYKLSCLSYSVSGLWYLYCLHFLSPALCTTPVMSGTAFGALLVVQGVVSYVNDAVVTMGKHVAPSRTFWTIADRCLAWLLMITTVSMAITWPSCGERASLVSAALVAVCAVSYPCSKYCECVATRGSRISHLHPHLPACRCACPLTSCVSPAPRVTCSMQRSSNSPARSKVASLI
jgi:hypothetical protein